MVVCTTKNEKAARRGRREEQFRSLSGDHHLVRSRRALVVTTNHLNRYRSQTGHDSLGNFASTASSPMSRLGDASFEGSSVGARPRTTRADRRRVRRLIRPIPSAHRVGLCSRLPEQLHVDISSASSTQSYLHSCSSSSASSAPFDAQLDLTFLPFVSFPAHPTRRNFFSICCLSPSVKMDFAPVQADLSLVNSVRRALVSQALTDRPPVGEASGLRGKLVNDRRTDPLSSYLLPFSPTFGTTNSPLPTTAAETVSVHLVAVIQMCIKGGSTTQL
ncbi:unnamed protein product [Protopolystoma xenopodis]|uniref:Uncharacterized protein n=1 Tax=Protopolystoma xenopodis TaxID=117903 RepID=A0A448WSU0_9PLAT|nr:unnamed protein product [Protopolystoma xenopodis]